MPEVKWIKILTDIFEDEKIRLIQAMPEGDALIVIWLKLLTQAGKTNAGGYIHMNESTPYTPEMLSIIFGKSQQIINFALNTFQQFGMIENTEHGIYVVNWEKHQNIEGLEKIREQNRLRKQRERERKRGLLPSSGQKFCAYCGKEANTIDHIIPRSKGGKDIPSNLVDCCKSCNSSKKDKDLANFLNDANVLCYDIDINLVLNNEKLMKYVTRDVTGHFTQNHALEEDKEEDKKRKDKDINTPYQKIKELYQSICKSFPKIRSITDERKKHLNARWKEYKQDIAIFEELFKKAEESDFLTGRIPNNKNWKCGGLDWLINQQNMAKVIEGKYDNQKPQQVQQPQRADLQRVADNDPKYLEFLKLMEQAEG